MDVGGIDHPWYTVAAQRGFPARNIHFFLYARKNRASIRHPSSNEDGGSS